MSRTSEEDRLRRCLHLMMRSHVNGKLDESKPCLHWECVERNRAADRIDELEAALADAEEHRVKHLLRIDELEATLARISKPPTDDDLCLEPDQYGHHVCGRQRLHDGSHRAAWTEQREW